MSFLNKVFSFLFLIFLSGCGGVDTKDIDAQSKVTKGITPSSVKGMSCATIDRKLSEVRTAFVKLGNSSDNLTDISDETLKSSVELAGIISENSQDLGHTDHAIGGILTLGFLSFMEKSEIDEKKEKAKTIGLKLKKDYKVLLAERNIKKCGL